MRSAWLVHGPTKTAISWLMRVRRGFAYLSSYRFRLSVMSTSTLDPTMPVNLANDPVMGHESAMGHGAAMGHRATSIDPPLNPSISPASDSLTGDSLALRLLTTDFCPWANRFVYWLKEPIGWFVLATLVCGLVGAYFSPIGWTMAGALVALIAVGMVWPLAAVNVVSCSLKPEIDTVHENDSCRLIVSVLNRVPLPVWGLTIEGYFDDETFDTTSANVGLACVPPMCRADYGTDVRPTLRGRYPKSPSFVACSFPFGIWTARKRIKQESSMTVWPAVYSITGVCPLMGRTAADEGEGQRGGRSGDFVGVRAYRRGDSAKQVNWVASARTDSLTISERGAPEAAELDVWIDTRPAPVLNTRIRVAASLLVHLHQTRVPMRVRIGDRLMRFGNGEQGRRQILEALTDIPLEGIPLSDTTSPLAQRSPSRPSLEISNSVCVHDPHAAVRRAGTLRHVAFNQSTDLATWMNRFWTEAGHDRCVA